MLKPFVSEFRPDLSVRLARHLLELCVTNSCTTFQANIFIFGCEMAQKPIDGNDIISLNLIFLNF